MDEPTSVPRMYDLENMLGYTATLDNRVFSNTSVALKVAYDSRAWAAEKKYQAAYESLCQCIRMVFDNRDFRPLDKEERAVIEAVLYIGANYQSELTPIINLLHHIRITRREEEEKKNKS